MQSIIKAFLFCIIFIGLLAALSFFKSFFPPEYERITYGILGTIAAFLATYLVLRVEKKSFADIGLKLERDTFKKFITGLLVGLVLTTVMLLSLFYIAGYKIVPTEGASIASFFLLTLALIPLAFMEEVAFRAYPLVTIEREKGVRAALIITSLFFALYHIVNGWSVPVSFLGPGIWGMVFGFAAVYSKGIAVPTGIHYAANLVQSAFGAKKDFGSIWSVQATEHISANAEVIGFVIQFVLLFGVIMAMELYAKRRRVESAPASYNSSKPNIS